MSVPEAAAEPWPLALVGRAIDLLIIIAGTLIVVLMFANVISRFIFNFDVAWSTELTGFLMIWATFLGGAAATRRGAHMRVGELVGLTSGRMRRAYEIAINGAVVLILVPLVWFGSLIALGNMDQDSTVLYYPMGLQYAALPVGSAFALLFLVHDTVRLLRGSAPSWQAVEI